MNLRTHRSAFYCLCLLLAARASVLANEPRSPRLVSLSPNLTELVFAIGLDAHLAGRSSACDAPSEVKHIPVVGDFGRPNHEALWKARPDVVLLTDLENPGTRAQLARRGVRVMTLPCESWDDMIDAARQLGAALNRPDAAEAWVHRLTLRLTTLKEHVAREMPIDSRPLIYVEIWGNPVTTAGRNSFLHEVIELAGGRHVGATLPGRYMAISAEWVIQTNPDTILLAYMLDGMRPADALRRRVGWRAIRAVREDRIIDDIDPDLLLRPGPRLIDGAEQLADRLQKMRLEQKTSNAMTARE